MGAHEHRLLRPPPARGPREPHGTGDGDGLGAVVGVAGEVGRRTRGPGGHHVAGGLARAAQHDGGIVEDLGRRPVAPVELDHLGRRPPAVDVEEELGVGAVPPVDRLLRVADRGDVVAIAAPGLQEAELERVHVLQLVHEQVPKPPALRGRERRRRPRGRGRRGRGGRRSRRGRRGACGSRRPRTPRRRRRACSAGLRRGARHGVHVRVRGDHASLGPLDLGGEVGGHGALVLAGRGRRQLAEQAALAVEQVERRAALVGPAGAQGAPGHAVERARRRVAAKAEAAQAVVELARRLAREGEGEDVPRVGRRPWPRDGRSVG